MPKKTSKSKPSSARKTPRAGKVAVIGYFEPAVRSSLFLIQAQAPEATVQDLLGEALNLLFAKYRVPEAAPKRPSP
jgi:hypothetical protein